KHSERGPHPCAGGRRHPHGHAIRTRLQLRGRAARNPRCNRTQCRLAHARRSLSGAVPMNTHAMPRLSILELGRVREGGDRRTALDEARELARQAEDWGYQRFWIAEHHNMPAVTTAATSLVIAHVAAGTRKIRVGAGGVMLPNHAPYIIAEQFGTLATLFPGRIDLGLGRAPGTDQMTLRALRRPAGNSDNFPQDVQELQAWLAPVQPGQRIEAVPG